MEKKTDLKDLKGKAVKGFFWRFCERISSQIVSFVISIILARLLMPEEYGIIALSMIFINIFSVFAVSGLGTSLIQKKDTDDLDFSTMFYAGAIFSCIIYILLFLFAPYIGILLKNEMLPSVLRVLGLLIPIQSVNSIQQAFVSRSLEFKKFFYATFIGTFLSGIVGVVMAYSGCGVWSLVGQQLSNHVINTFTLNRVITWRPKLLFSWNRFLTLFSFGSKMMGANLLGTFFNELKGFIIGLKYTPADLAFYNRGESLPSLISNNVNNTINSVLFPTISKVQDDKAAVKSAIRRSMKISSYIVVPIMLFMAAAAEQIVLILLTDKWLFCVPFMRVLCINHCLGILSTANLQAINAIGRSDVTLKLEFIKKPIYLMAILSAMVVSPFAIAVATTIYSFIGFVINARPNKRLINYKLMEQVVDVYPQFLLSLFMAVIVYAIGMLELNLYVTLGTQICVSVAVYLIFSKLFALESYQYIVNNIKMKLH